MNYMLQLCRTVRPSSLCLLLIIPFAAIIKSYNLTINTDIFQDHIVLFVVVLSLMKAFSAVRLSDALSHYLRATGASFDSRGCVLAVKSQTITTVPVYVMSLLYPCITLSTALFPHSVSANLSSFTSFFFLCLPFSSCLSLCLIATEVQFGL